MPDVFCFRPVLLYLYSTPYVHGHGSPGQTCSAGGNSPFRNGESFTAQNEISLLLGAVGCCSLHKLPADVGARHTKALLHQEMVSTANVLTCIYAGIWTQVREKQIRPSVVSQGINGNINQTSGRGQANGSSYVQDKYFLPDKAIEWSTSSLLHR